ncbi:MAG TPA: peptide-methionine (R)-S-oxide reductase MsrB [Pararhizobium sp.]|nr:peptide-methionine (R)-S-oxide reductase MsrB [Pararhizobium sp.]
MLSRRNFLLSGAGLAAFAGIGLSGWPRGSADAADKKFPYALTDAEWRKKLTSAQYNILRENGTEPPFTSPLLKEERVGIYHCVGCDNALYSSKTKFHSGTGWPSFYESLPNAVGTRIDNSLFVARTEVHCARCGGHLGHVFDDGPPPTGKRHCIDGIALDFVPKADA